MWGRGGIHGGVGVEGCEVHVEVGCLCTRYQELAGGEERLGEGGGWYRGHMQQSLPRRGGAAAVILPLHPIWLAAAPTVPHRGLSPVHCHLGQQMPRSQLPRPQPGPTSEQGCCSRPGAAPAPRSSSSSLLPMLRCSGQRTAQPAKNLPA